MGAWGPESCSSDACWDLMHSIPDIHKPQQRHVEKCMHDVLRAEACSFYPRARFGVVVWLLDHGMIVPDKYLAWAEQEGECLIDLFTHDEDRDSDRVPILEQELEIVRAARANGGKGVGRKVKGLFDRINDAVASGTPGLVNQPA